MSITQVRYRIQIIVHQGGYSEVIFHSLLRGIRGHIYVETGHMIDPPYFNDEETVATFSDVFIANLDVPDGFPDPVTPKGNARLLKMKAEELAERINQLSAKGQKEIFNREWRCTIEVAIEECCAFEAVQQILFDQYLRRAKRELEVQLSEYGNPLELTWDRILREYPNFYSRLKMWRREHMNGSEVAANLIETMMLIEKAKNE